MRQLTKARAESVIDYLSKLPMRQLTLQDNRHHRLCISKLPMRQLTNVLKIVMKFWISKLPMRQLTR